MEGFFDLKDPLTKSDGLKSPLLLIYPEID